MTTTTGRTGRATPVAAPASRALLAAVLALVVTFSLDHTDPARFGLLVLGGYLVLQAALLLAWTRRLARTRTGTLLLLARSGVSLVAGLLALARPDAGVDLLLAVEVSAFLLIGGLEVAGGAARAEGIDAAGDAIVVGGLQVVVGLMLLILNADPLFSVGVLSAWGALVAVYLGISAANLRIRRRR